MNWQDRWTCIFRKIRTIPDRPAEEHLLLELADVDSPLTVGFINAHAMNKLVSDLAFYEVLMRSDVLLRDGKGMEMLFRHRGMPPGINMNGTDFIPKILAAYRGRDVALWGTEEPCLGLAAKKIEQDYGVRLVSCRHGFENATIYSTLAGELKPDLILLAMGMPKQEVVASQISDTLGSPALIVCGGAILDFLGDRVARAPLWMRKRGLEWLYRLLLEPRRLFVRYIIGNPIFLLRMIRWH
jgi:exopolysaccharide biosynthesis WecB/TagA/CpsF family protein